MFCGVGSDVRLLDKQVRATNILNFYIFKENILPWKDCFTSLMPPNWFEYFKIFSIDPEVLCPPDTNDESQVRKIINQKT